MYVILVNHNNTLSAPIKQRIMQRSKLVDTLYFLVEPFYNGLDMSQYTVVMEYLRPVSRKYKTEILTLSDEREEEFLKYILPIDTDITQEAGKVELHLSFIRADMNVEGDSVQRVRKTDDFLLTIVSISAWSDIVPDNVLTPLDRRILEIDARLNAVNDLADFIESEKADDISYKDGKLQLVSNEKPIGTIVEIQSCNENLEDGVPVVDFSIITPDDTTDSDSKNDNVVDMDKIEENSNKTTNNVLTF